MKNKTLTFLMAMLSMATSVVMADTREYVDLGLPSGTLWATCNIGADNPEDYGDYFSWGETIGYKGGKSSFSWSTYIYCNGTEDSMNKYCSNSSYGHNGFTDTLTELELTDDAAYINWGQNWQMPTQSQFAELTNNTYTSSTLTTQNGVYGRKITSKINGKSIFLPAAGFRSSSLTNAGAVGVYWSRTLDTDWPFLAWGLSIKIDVNVNNYRRFYGRSVRPVRSKSKYEHEYVDLGLPSGTLWATCNVGADSPEEYGDYFAWGETTAKTTFEWSNYKWCNGSENTLTKYNYNSSYGTVDNKMELDPEDDAAYVNWGSSWRTPTMEQRDELCNNCNWTLTTYNGVNGYRVTGPNGNTIFLPQAGWGNGEIVGEGEYGNYATSTLDSSDPTKARAWSLKSYVYTSHNWRCLGRSIRPVRDSHVLATGLTLSPSSLSLAEGESAQLAATVSPSEAAATTLTWRSSDTQVATVGQDGLVVAVAGGTCTITCETTDGSGLSATCAVTVKEVVNLIDGTAFTNDADKEVDELTYTRNFTNTEWQALYVPFEMQYEDWKDDFDVARLNDVHQWDDDDDGTIDRTALEIVKLKSGKTEANTPYLIRAKATGEYTFTLTNATLYKAEEKSFDVSSWNTKFTFTGTYSGVSGTDMFTNGYYAMGSGSLHQAESSANALSPMRWYMKVTDRDGNPKNLGEVKIQVFGEDGTDGLTSTLSQGEEEGAVFDLSGRRMEKPTKKGMYIRNGRKVIVR